MCNPPEQSGETCRKLAHHWTLHKLSTSCASDSGGNFLSLCSARGSCIKKFELRSNFVLAEEHHSVLFEFVLYPIETRVFGHLQVFSNN